VFGQCLSSNVGDHALTPPTRHSLGKPLPYQQADRTQAPLKALCLATIHHLNDPHKSNTHLKNMLNESETQLYSIEIIVYYPRFRGIIHDFEADSYALLTRLPWV